MSKIAAALWPFLKAIPHSYATILFSDNLWLGLGLLLLTMVSPIVGLSGLFGLLVALLLTRITGFEDWHSSSGVLAFNSLLIALTIGYYFPLSGLVKHLPELAALITISSIATLILYVVLSYFTQNALKLPSMSLAFSIMAMLGWYFLVRSGNFNGTGFMKPLLFDLQPKLAWFWRDYFLSMGSIMFVPDVVVGMGVALILLSITRIGFMLSLFGWAICWWLLGYASIGTTYGMFFPGFNLILISISVGSVYLIPGKSSYLIAAIATVAGFAVAFALSGKYIFPDYMPARGEYLFVPMFAFPFNLVVMTTIFALRQRRLHRPPVLNEVGLLHPEKALDAYISRYKRFSSTGIPQILLPVTGEWVVTQGHNGAHTHQKDWAHAWDFEMEDVNGKKYSSDPADLKDYYCFGKPVHAAAAGYVAKVVNGVPDNPVGITNTQENWGNYVSIYHMAGYYTLYAHLREGSVKLSEGDYIKQGEKIGQVGNSGRSPVPHLHFQVQEGAEAGTRSVFSHILNFKIDDDAQLQTFIGSGIPKEGDKVSPLMAEKELAYVLQLGYHQEQNYQVRIGDQEFTETWKVELDLLGVHRIHSSRGSILEFSIFNGIFNALNLTGSRASALSAFAVGASRIPWADNARMAWEDEPSLSVLMNSLAKNVTLFFLPFFHPIRIQTRSTLSHEKKLLRQTSETTLRILGMPLKRYKACITMSRAQGIELIDLSQNGRKLLIAEKMPVMEDDDHA
jgi:urea transporter